MTGMQAVVDMVSCWVEQDEVPVVDGSVVEVDVGFVIRSPSCNSSELTQGLGAEEEA